MTDEPSRVRAPVVRIVDHGASTTVLGPEVVRRFDGDSAALLRAVLEIHARPVGRTELLAELAARAGVASPAELPAQPIDELVALLALLRLDCALDTGDLKLRQSVLRDYLRPPSVPSPRCECDVSF